MWRWLRGLLIALGGLTLLFFVAALVTFVTTRDRVPPDAVLTLDLERAIVEHIPPDPLARALLGRHWELHTLVATLRRAAEDDRIHGLIARVGDGDHGLATVQEIRQAVQSFRASGKPAFVYAETMGELGPGNLGYYLATAFDRIYLQASGDVGLTGLIAETPFLRGTLDRLGIEPRLDQRHEYKTAMNTLTETGYTEAHQAADTALVADLFRVMVTEMAEARGLQPEALANLIDLGPLLGVEAVEAGLVDGLAFADEVYAALFAAIEADYALVDGQRYAALALEQRRGSTPVALIHGSGAVVRGTSSFNPLVGATMMGSDTLVTAFRAAIDDDAIRAILFRVDSPGGSYVASDTIWRMVHKAREAGKPVVISMGNTAASGGYYVAMNADRIIAQPGTLTGSIGVLGGKVLTRELWDRGLGVQWEAVRSSDNADMWTSTSDYSEHGWARTQAWLDRVYDDFTAKAAAGRGLPLEQVRLVARGRVWTGAQAKEHGLVDSLGGFDEAERAIRELLELEPDAPLALRRFPEPLGWLEALRRGEPSAVASSAALAALEALQPTLRKLHQAGILHRPGELETVVPQIR